MSPQELKKLQEKYLAGLCTQEELEQLMSDDENFLLIKQQWLAERGDQEQVKLKILQQLHQSIESLEALNVPAKKAFKFSYYYATAAAVLIALFTLILIPRKTINNQKIAKATLNKRKELIKPGSNKATLTLSNGTIINLTEAENGTVSRQGNVTVGKTADGKLVYKITPGKNTAEKNEVLVYNTISTPRGGEYQVVLPDGTKVWLNAESSLRFPSVFPGKDRKVELSGEAYFEVAKNKEKPFKIAVAQMGIEVLGTHFNVNAYPGEAKIKTTLLAGSVKLTAGKNQSLLQPGQEASLNQREQSGFDIRKVNAQDAIAWKNGYFVFDNQNIQEIMKKIARWYDMDVEYKGKVQQGNFGGTVSRFDNVDAILKSLELTGTVHFKVEGRRITVMP